jgi:photosystem II stability/assembly factor-like uncharacterized protein
MSQARVEMIKVSELRIRHHFISSSAYTYVNQNNFLGHLTLVAFVLSLSTGISSGQDKWQWQNPLPQGNTLRGVHAVNTNLVFTVGDAGTVMKTTNGGSTWAVQSSGTLVNLNGVWFVDAGKGFAVGDSGTILRTTDGGTAWVPQSTGTTDPFYAVSFVGADTGTAVGYPGMIRRTTDGGRTWVTQFGGSANYFLAVS